MARRKSSGDPAFGNLSFLDVLANLVGAITFLFLMFFVIISGLVMPSKFRVVTDTLPDARSDAAYKISLAAVGGVEPYSWSIDEGRLPENVVLDKKTGTVEGAPELEGTYRFVLKVADSSEGKKLVVKQPLVLRVRKPSDRPVLGNMPLEIATDQMTPGAVGRHYDITLAATGGEEPYFWSVIDGLPPGLILQDDRLMGILQTSGDWRFTFRVEDSASSSFEQEFLLTVRDRAILTEERVEPLTIATDELPDAVVRREYNVALAPRGGVPPYTWSIERGELPRGLLLDGFTGVISGKTPQVAETNFVIGVTDSNSYEKDVAQARLSLNVSPIFFEATAQNPLFTWWVLVLVAILVIIGLALLMAYVIGVQCPWDRSWRCKPVGKDPRGRTIYTCKHGHTFVNEPRLLSKDAEEEPTPT